MITWIRSKIFFAHLKKEIFKAFSHGDDWMKFLTNLAISYKNATPDEIRKEFVSALAGKVHDSVSKEREKKDSE